MYQKLILVFFASVNALVIDENSLRTMPSSPTAVSSQSLATTSSFVAGPRVILPKDDDTEIGLDYDENGPPDEHDKSWTKRFMSGEAVEPLLDFHAGDLIHRFEHQIDPNAATIYRRTASPSNGTEIDDLTTELATLRLGLALAQAHTRSRLRRAEKNQTGIPDAEGIAWAQIFLSGREVTNNMIFNSTDLRRRLDDHDYENGELHDFQKRQYTPPLYVIRGFNRAQQAIQRARHRARVRHKKSRASHIKHVGTVIDGPGAHKPVHPTPRPGSHSNPSSYKPQPGPLHPDGSINCEWWYCYDHSLPCGNAIPDPNWDCSKILL